MRRAVVVLVFVLALAGPALAATHQVTIDDNAYAPSPLTVQPGDTVTWTNRDTVQHSVTATDGSYDSGRLLPLQAFEHRYDTPGTYRYYCTVHGAPMVGTVRVQGATTTTRPTTTTWPTTTTAESEESSVTAPRETSSTTTTSTGPGDTTTTAPNGPTTTTLAVAAPFDDRDNDDDTTGAGAVAALLLAVVSGTGAVAARRGW